jgi:translation initiation factor IF-1
MIDRCARRGLNPSTLNSMSPDPLPLASPASRPPRFGPVLSQARFEGLRTILQRVCHDPAALQAAVLGTSTYEHLLARLGHKLVLTRQIHVQDDYSKLSREGGVKAVLPYYDIPTQSSLPTLLNWDASVSTTPQAAAFFGGLLGEFKKQLELQACARPLSTRILRSLRPRAVSGMSRCSTDRFVERHTMKEEPIEVEGKIATVLAGTMFRVELDNKHVVLATICGKMRKRWVRITVGDRVKLEMSPYDLNRGRITWRLR